MTHEADSFTIFGPDGLTGFIDVSLNPCNQLDSTTFCQVFAFDFPDFLTPTPASEFNCSGLCSDLYFSPTLAQLSGTAFDTFTLDSISFSGNELTVSGHNGMITAPSVRSRPVGFPALYYSRHILHAIEVGPASRLEGFDALKKSVAVLPKSADIVIYCGCCPMVKCPNVRPAYRMLKELGFTNVRVLSIPTDMHVDWYSKDYSAETGAAAR